jgi:beta-glucanase (GH16 family)
VGGDAAADDPSGSDTAPTARGGANVGGSGGKAGSPSRGGSGGSGGSAVSSGGTSSASGGSAGSGTAGKSGSGGGTGSSTGGAPAISPEYKLLWRDDFDSFNGERWQKATHGFEENEAVFAPENAVVEGGILKLRVTKTPRGGKPYSAAEIYTRQTFTFGRFEGRIRFAKGSGVVSSLFTYKDDANTEWNEIDVEYLGYIPQGIQYNLISGTGGNRKYQPKVVKTAFAPAEEFHDHAIEWAPGSIKFYIDGKLTHQDTQPSISKPARLRMNVWPTNNDVTNFAGPLDAAAIPTEGQYDWVAVYEYKP